MRDIPRPLRGTLFSRPPASRQRDCRSSWVDQPGNRVPGGGSRGGPRTRYAPAMCNLYSITKGQAAIRELARAMVDRAGNLPPLPGIFPDYGAPIVREGPEGREIALARWGMPSPLFALKGKKTDPGVTNIRNTKSPHWRRWLGPDSRCLVPFTSFSENELSPGGSRQPIWFAFDEDRPLAFFAGIWTRWTSVRKLKEGEVTADLFGFLTTEPNAEVAAVHPQAMPVILTTAEAQEVWLRAPMAEALDLARPLPDGFLRVVARGQKQDGVGDLVNVAARASQRHEPLPLPLLSQMRDLPDDAATVAEVENTGGQRANNRER